MTNTDPSRPQRMALASRLLWKNQCSNAAPSRSSAAKSNGSCFDVSCDIPIHLHSSRTSANRKFGSCVSHVRRPSASQRHHEP